MKLEPNILCFTETWFEEVNSTAYNLDDYTAFHLIRPDRSHGGVTVYVNSKINAIKIPSWTFINDDIEILTLDVTFETKTYKLCTIYRPQFKYNRINLMFKQMLNSYV